MTTTSPPVHPTKARVVEAAVALTTDIGWAHVTMAGIAELVGVSRQTVYNEIGTKKGLAEAMIHAELDRVLGVVAVAFDDHPDDLVEAIRQASRTVLELAQDNLLLHAVVSATHGADTDLLPLLTTHADSLLGSAKGVLVEGVARYGVDLDPRHVEDVIDMVVRVVLSHVMAPSASPAATSESLAWIVDRVLTGPERHA